MSHCDDPQLFYVPFLFLTRKKLRVVAMSHCDDPQLFYVPFLPLTRKKLRVVAMSHGNDSSLNNDPQNMNIAQVSLLQSYIFLHTKI